MRSAVFGERFRAKHSSQRTECAARLLSGVSLVRCQGEEPFDALRLLMACGQRYPEAMSLFDEARRMAPSLSRGISFVYILRLRSGAFYVGCSNDAETRFAEHAAGTACRTTAIDPPIAVLFIELRSDFAEARGREAQIKKWSRAKKEALVAGDLLRLKSLSQSRD